MTPPHIKDASELVDSLPITQQLVLEVLAARFRTGEKLWPFSTKAGPALEALSAQGFLWYKGGVIEKTYRASLTELGRQAVLDPTYVPPTSRTLV